MTAEKELCFAIVKNIFFLIVLLRRSAICAIIKKHNEIRIHRVDFIQKNEIR